MRRFAVTVALGVIALALLEAHPHPQQRPPAAGPGFGLSALGFGRCLAAGREPDTAGIGSPVRQDIRHFFE